MTWYEVLRIWLGRCSRCSTPRPHTTLWMRRQQPLCPECRADANWLLRRAYAVALGMDEVEAEMFADDSGGWN